MTEAEVQEKVMKMLTPFAKDEAALEGADGATRILDDLQVNSARLVDLILAFEDEFDIEIADEEVDGVESVGDCVDLILRKAG